jgi:hypothetical protein
MVFAKELTARGRSEDELNTDYGLFIGRNVVEVNIIIGFV